MDVRGTQMALVDGSWETNRELVDGNGHRPFKQHHVGRENQLILIMFGEPVEYVTADLVPRRQMRRHVRVVDDHRTAGIDQRMGRPAGRAQIELGIADD